MMPTTLGQPHPAAYPPFTTDAVLDDLSRHMAASQAARRLSRGSNGQRAGNAMRVVKPTSANSSPRSSTSMGRRRTFVNEANLARRHHVLDHQVVLPHQSGAEFCVDAANRAPRPMSWHPASSHHIQQPQVPPRHLYGQAHPSDASHWNDLDAYTNYHHMSPMPTSYSCHTSPSTFSPLTLPLNDFGGQPPSLQQDGRSQSTQQQAPSYVSPGMESNAGFPESFPSLSSGCTAVSRSSGTADWNSFLLHGFDKTSPPTPENLPRMHEPKTALAEEAIPYEPLESREEEGEILMGMGLYDTPDKSDPCPGFGNHYRPPMSLLMGGSRGQQSPGKGLKLEETWEPPQSEDEEDDEDDEDDDEEEE